jgi:hypothetical protein
MKIGSELRWVGGGGRNTHPVFIVLFPLVFTCFHLLPDLIVSDAVTYVPCAEVVKSEGWARLHHRRTVLFGQLFLLLVF